VYGDVIPGAVVRAAGGVIVLGRLAGKVHAGGDDPFPPLPISLPSLSPHAPPFPYPSFPPFPRFPLPLPGMGSGESSRGRHCAGTAGRQGACGERWDRRSVVVALCMEPSVVAIATEVVQGAQGRPQATLNIEPSRAGLSLHQRQVNRKGRVDPVMAHLPKTFSQPSSPTVSFFPSTCSSSYPQHRACQPQQVTFESTQKSAPAGRVQVNGNSRADPGMHRACQPQQAGAGEREGEGGSGDGTPCRHSVALPFFHSMLLSPLLLSAPSQHRACRTQQAGAGERQGRADPVMAHLASTHLMDVSWNVEPPPAATAAAGKKLSRTAVASLVTGAYICVAGAMALAFPTFTFGVLKFPVVVYFLDVMY
ncbi:unnamed protein product, partial [Closterium sp. NIES-65]